jgi:alpha-N-arabinofuranosidase
MEDALVAGCMLITLLKNADRVKVACLAQLINVIAPIMTEKGGKAWRQSIFYPFMHASKYGRGTVLRCPAVSEKYDSREYEGVPYLETAAVHDEAGEALTIFAVNRNLTEKLDLEAGVHGFEGYRFIEHITLHNPDLKAVNSAREEKLRPAAADGGKLEGTTLRAVLPPASWNVLRLGKR